MLILMLNQGLIRLIVMDVAGIGLRMSHGGNLGNIAYSWSVGDSTVEVLTAARCFLDKYYENKLIYKSDYVD